MSARAREEVTDAGVCQHQVPRKPVDPCLQNGSAAEATRVGEGGVYNRYSDGEAHITIAKGTYLTNFKVEFEALQKAAVKIRDNVPRTKPNVIIFTGALSVLSKLHSPRQRDLCDVETALVDLAAQTNLTCIGFQHTAESKDMNKQAC